MDSSTGAKPKIQECKKKRKVSVPVDGSSHKKSLEALKQMLKRKMSLPDGNIFNSIVDPMAKARDCFSKKRGLTGISYDEKMFDHFCLWDPKYPENPQRLKSIIDRCNELGLIERCHRLPTWEATKEDLQLTHSESMINLLESLKIASEDRLKEVSSKNDSIYTNKYTYTAACTAVGCAIESTKAVVNGTVHNAMALVRPPGHHAMNNDYCGYCFFNNVAIAAKYAVNKLNLKRVMIVDWDVHHGQGTQQTFYKDNRVLYFSMHRYEHGNFWPNLREGDYDYIGEGKGAGFNFNIPINETGMLNQDYFHILHNVLLPVAYEFNPELILISAGYDAAVGCPEGLMKLTPAFFAHITHSLMGLAGGKVVVILEGGYFIESLAESAAHTLRSLLGDPCPRLVDPLTTPSLSIKETIFNVMLAHRDYWKCFQFMSPDFKGEWDTLDPHPSLMYPLKDEESKFNTMGCYPTISKEEEDAIRIELQRLRTDTSLTVPNNRLCIVYDEAMEKHKNESELSYPERPARIIEIMKKLKEAEILKRILLLKPREATLKELQAVHAMEWLTSLQNLKYWTEKKRYWQEQKYVSIYFNEFSTDAALCAAGCLLQVVDSVCKGESRSGIGVIRPPGHHAECHQPFGFCLINNVAVAASYAIKKYNLERILVLDWDIHHGNGIQNMFMSNPKVLYLSIHAYCGGEFFPGSYAGDSYFVGEKSGRGYNVNIPWSKLGMKDGDYLSAFFHVILPICYEFNPELVLVSAGFDAAVNDPLGRCYITPECFGHMTHFLMSLASGKVILALEGGYNLISTSTSMTTCAKTLLGDPLPQIEKTTASSSARKIIHEVIQIQEEFWNLLYLQDKIHLEVKAKRKLNQSPQTPEFSTPLEGTPFGTPIKEVDVELDLVNNLQKCTISNDVTDVSLKADISIASNPTICNETTTETEAELEGAVGGRIDNPRLLILEKLLQMEGVCAVVPLADCPHLTFVRPVPQEGLNATAPCATCFEQTENWVCLVCYQVYCSRYCNSDMLLHNTESGHPMTLSFFDLSVWCYVCDSYVNNIILNDALEAAAKSKFGP